MVELLVNGRQLELQEKGNEIKYNMQISDIFDIASVTASYTNSFTVPKTPLNTQIFQQLGLIGDTSSLPYTKVPVVLKSNGFDIIKSGWLNIKSSGKDYKVSIIDGMIDFFKAIENKTLGNDLDLSQFNHIKSLENVINSMSITSTLPYKYMVADYNGMNYGYALGEYGINIDYLIPSFSVRRLWDIIFQTFSYNYEGSEMTFLDELYITYPLPPQEAPNPVHIAQFNKTNFVTSNSFAYHNGRVPIDWATWSQIDVSEGSIVDGRKFKIPATSGYQIVVDIDAYLSDVLVGGQYPAWAIVLLNGSTIYALQTNPEETLSFTHNFYANQNDVLELILWYDDVGSWQMIETHHLNTNFGVYRIDMGEVSITNAFKDFKIKDFFKEIIWRTGYTPVIDVLTKKMNFIKISDRIDFSRAVDWTSKYITRTNETYIMSDYGQKNTFKLKHDNDADLTGNGYLYVDNKNLTDEKVLAESKLYSPEITATLFTPKTGSGAFTTDRFRIWNREPKESEGVQTIEYKGLSNRYYFIRPTYSGSANWMFVSMVLNTNQTVNGVIPIGISLNTLFDELIYSNYLDFSKILSNFRLHTIELALGIHDILGLDFTRPYFFAQEVSYYMLNKITWQDGDTCTGEFARINKLN